MNNAIKITYIIISILIFSGNGYCDSNTSNLNLERPSKGATNWSTSLNSNFTKIDAGYGNNIASIADLPEVYIETGTFNSTSGDVITLPKSVDAVNEYYVGVIATSRAGAIGDIWVSQTTSNFTVYCSDVNATDTYAAIIYYIGDVSSYGGAMYRRWYVSPDANITDHSDSSDAGSFAWVLSEIGASPAVIEFPGNKTYNIVDYDVTVNDNIALRFQQGAILNCETGRVLSIAGSIIAGESEIFSMVDRDSMSYTGPTPLHSKWFGAKHDDSTLDSNALNDMVGATATGGTVIIDNGITRCNSVDFDVDNMTVINRGGTFKPASDSGYCIRIGKSGSSVHNITGYDIDVDSGSNYATYDTVTAVQIMNLYSSEIHFKRVEGCAFGLYLTNDTATGVVYNKFFLGRMVDNEVNVKLDPASSGWVNENNFYGGRFTHSSGIGDYDNTWHVRIEYDATNNTNGNKFYGPSFEGGGTQIAYFGGVYNSIQDARVEQGGGYSANSIYFDSNSARNEFTTEYSNGLLSNGYSITDTITSVNSTQFTIDADVTKNIFRGQLLEITLDDASEHVAVVYGASYSDPNTTVRIAYDIPDYVDTTNEIASIKTLPVYNAGRTNHFIFKSVNYPSVANLQYEMWDETLAFRYGGLVLKGLGSKIPALNLTPGSSAANTVLSISDFTGKTIDVDASGNITIYDSATGQKLIDVNISNVRIRLYDASENEAVRLDGLDGSVSMLIASDGSGVANNSLFRRSSDNKICWKDNSGSINALY